MDPYVGDRNQLSEPLGKSECQYFHNGTTEASGVFIHQNQQNFLPGFDVQQAAT